MLKDNFMMQSLRDILEYIKNEGSEGDQEADSHLLPEARLRTRLTDLIQLLLGGFDERMEFDFFFKNCQFNFDVVCHDFQEVFYAIGKAVQADYGK
jgi:hypothetical protein